MKAPITFLLLVLAMPLASRATSYVPVGVKEHLQGARVVAHIEVIGNVPERIFPGVDFACGATVTARVIESFKGTEAGRTITFGSEGMKVGSQYLIALHESDPNARSSVLLLLEEMSSREAEEMAVACKQRLPELESSWRVTSELVSPKWMPWGYRIIPPTQSAGLTFIGRKAQNTIESLSYVDEKLTVASTASFSEDHPEYGPLVASRFDFPTLYVEWDSYRNFLRNAF